MRSKKHLSIPVTRAGKVETILNESSLHRVPGSPAAPRTVTNADSPVSTAWNVPRLHRNRSLSTDARPEINYSPPVAGVNRFLPSSRGETSSEGNSRFSLASGITRSNGGRRKSSPRNARRTNSQRRNVVDGFTAATDGLFNGFYEIIPAEPAVSRGPAPSPPRSRSLNPSPISRPTGVVIFLRARRGRTRKTGRATARHVNRPG